MYFTVEPNIQICGLLYGGYVAYPCLRWLWHWWRLNWRHWPLTRWCSRHRSHWRSDVTPAGTPWRAPPCCMPCELALSTLRPESHCTPLWEGWRKKTNHQQKKNYKETKSLYCLIKCRSIYLPWQVTVISKAFLSISDVAIMVLSICTISTFSMPSENKDKRGGRSSGQSSQMFTFWWT